MATATLSGVNSALATDIKTQAQKVFEEIKAAEHKLNLAIAAKDDAAADEVAWNLSKVLGEWGSVGTLQERLPYDACGDAASYLFNFVLDLRPPVTAAKMENRARNLKKYEEFFADCEAALSK